MAVVPTQIPVSTSVPALTLAAGTTGGVAVANSIDAVNDYALIYQNSSTSTLGINRNTYLGLSNPPVGTLDSQTVGNKTLSNTNTLTIKDAANFTIQNASDITKQARFSLASITTANTRTYTLPDISDTLTTLTATQTLTNKTLTSPTINSPTISNATITSDSYAGYTASTTGSIYGMSVTAGVLASAALLNTVNTAALQTNAVGASNIATSAITLGKLIYTTSQVSFSGTSVTQMTGMTLAVTIPSGGRSVEISVLIPNVDNTGGATNIYISIWDGTVGSGTQLQEIVQTPGGSGFLTSFYAYAVVTPAAGAKTYNIGWRVSSNAVSTQINSTVPSIILVKAI